MASLVSSDTTHGEPSFVPRNASIASGIAGKVIANGWGGSKSLSTSRKRTARRCYDHQDLRAICLLSRPAVAWINAIETGLARDRARRVPGGRRENAWTVGLGTRQFSHLERCLRSALQFGRPREENSVFHAGRQSELEYCAPRSIGLCPQAAPMGVDDGSANREPHSHSTSLCRVKWREDPIEMFRINSWSRIANCDEEAVRLA